MHSLPDKRLMGQLTTLVSVDYVQHRDRRSRLKARSHTARRRTTSDDNAGLYSRLIQVLLVHSAMTVDGP